jgi:hypothetical protein
VKKVVLLSLAAALALGYWGCKKSESQEPTGPGMTENYFPNNDGTNYKYSYLRIDSTGLNPGTRSTFYKGNADISGTPYKIQIDSLILNSVLQSVDSTYFRTTSVGAYYYIDTTGFAASISDSSLIPLIPFVTIDKELLAYSFPLQTNKSWTVFKINLTSPVFVTIVDVSALVVGQEMIVLSLPTGPTYKDAYKIKYTLTRRLNTQSPMFQTFTANVWLVQDIGPAKWEGSGTLVNIITGLGIDFGDTTTVVKESLIDYQIK